MAIVANLTQEQQTKLEEVLTGFKAQNDSLIWKFFNQQSEIVQPLQQIKEEAKQPQLNNQELEEKIDALSRKLDLIFGDHIMIDGKLVRIGNIVK